MFFIQEINLVFSGSALRLQFFIIITGVAFFVFAFIVPNMSAMRVWLGASAILTFGYVGVLLVVSIIDGSCCHALQSCKKSCSAIKCIYVSKNS